MRTFRATHDKVKDCIDPQTKKQKRDIRKGYLSFVGGASSMKVEPFVSKDFYNKEVYFSQGFRQFVSQTL